MKRVLKWIGYGLGLVVFIVVASLVFLTLPPGEHLLKSLLEDQLSDRLYQRVSIGTLRTNLLSQVALTDLRIHSSDSTASGTIAAVGRIALQYDLSHLFQRELRITRLDIDSVSMNLERDAHAHSNVALVDSLDVLIADTTPPPIVVLVDTVTVNISRASIRDDSLAVQADVHGLSLYMERADSDAYHFRARLSRIAGEYDAIPVNLSDWGCDGGWNAAHLRIDTLSGTVMGLRVGGLADYGFGDSVIGGQCLVEGDLDSVLNPLAARFGWPAIRAAGEARCLVIARGTLSEPEIRVSLDLPPVQTGQLRMEDTRVDLVVVGDTVTIDSVTLGVFGGRIRVQGRVGLDSTFLSDIRVRASGLSLQQLARFATDSMPPVKGRLGGELILTGALIDPSALAVASEWRTQGARWQKRAVPEITVHASLHDSLVNVRASGAGAELTAHIRSVPGSLEGGYTLTIPDLTSVAPLFGSEELTGRMTVGGQVSGDYTQPSTRAVVRGTDIVYQNVTVDSVVARVHYANDSLSVESAALAGYWQYTDSAHVPFDWPLTGGRLSFNGDAVGSLSDVDGRLEIELTEIATDSIPAISGHLGLTLQDSRRMMLNADLTAADLAMILTGAGDIGDSAFSTDIVLSRAYTTHDSGPPILGRIAVDGRYHGADRFRAEFSGAMDDLAALADLWPTAEIPTGRLAVAGQAQGRFDNPQVTGDLTVRQLQFAGGVVDSGFVQFTFDRDALRCDTLRLYAPGAEAHAQATIPLGTDSVGAITIDMTRPSRGRLYVPELDCALARPYMPPGSEFAGRLVLDCSWEGPLAKPTTAGRIALTQVYFLRDSLSPAVHDAGAWLVIADTSLTLDSLRGRIGDYPFAVQGTLFLRNISSFSGDIDFDLDQLGTGQLHGIMHDDSLEVFAETRALRLAAIAPFVPEVRNLRGSVDCNLRVHGQRDAPSAEGRIAVSELSFCHPMLDSCLRDGRIALTFSGETTRLDTLVLRYGPGAITASGFAVHPNLSLQESDVSFKATDLHYERPKFANVNVRSVSMRLRRDSSSSQLSGDIEMGDSRLVARIKPQSLTPWARSVERAGPTVPGFLEGTQLDLRLRRSDSLWVDNNLARIRLAADIRVSGNMAQPVVTGRVGIEEGYLLYLDRRFTVREGELLFADPTKISPDIILRADTRVTSYSGMLATPYTITLAIEGRPEDFTLDLYSDPAADYADILSLLTVGATRKQFTGTEGEAGGGTGGVLVTRGAELLGRRVTGFMTSQVGNRLGLDEVTVEGNLFGPNGRNNARLLASRRLGERLNLTYSTAVGHLNDQAIRLNYRLTRRFSLEGQTTQQGRSLLGLEYSLPIR